MTQKNKNMPGRYKFKSKDNKEYDTKTAKWQKN